ncbi:hypothetical protein C8Q74DRAFT_1369708 [Fomes fomentarius]|nr:hypothetical protein C8Q74DRAFT_1369708 [Fomes fomentarius]
MTSGCGKLLLGDHVAIANASTTHLNSALPRQLRLLISWTVSFHSVLETVTPESRDDLLEEIQHFVETLKVKKGLAADLRDQFRSLADNVRLFLDKITLVLEQADAGLQQELKSAQGSIESLSKELDELEKKIKTLTIGTISEVAVGAVAAGVAIFTFNLFAVVTAVSCFVGSIATGVEIDEAKYRKTACQDNLAQAHKNLTEIKGRQALLKQYTEELEQVKHTINGVAEQIATIATIWEMIHLDMHRLSENLAKTVSGNAPLTKFFMTKIMGTKAVYAHLHLLLQMYVEEVAPVMSGREMA